MRLLFLLSLLLHTALGSYLDSCHLDWSVLDPQSISNIHDNAEKITLETEGCVSVSQTSLHCDFKNDGKKYYIDDTMGVNHIEISNTQNLMVLYFPCETLSYDFKNVMGIIFHPMVTQIDLEAFSDCCKPININADNCLFNSVTLLPHTTIVSNEVNVTQLVSINSLDIEGNSSTKIDLITLVVADRYGTLKSLYIEKLHEQMHATGSKRFDKLKNTGNLEITDVQINMMNYNVFRQSMLSLKNSMIYNSNMTVYPGGELKLSNSIMLKGNVDLRNGSIFEVDGEHSSSRPQYSFLGTKNHLELGKGPLYKIESFDQLPDFLRWYTKSKYLVYAPDWFQLKHYDKVQAPLKFDFHPLSTEELQQLCKMDESKSLICDLSTSENNQTLISSENLLPLMSNSSTSEADLQILNANDVLFHHSGEFSEKRIVFQNIQKLHLERSRRDEIDSRSDFNALFLINTSVPIIEGYIDTLVMIESNIDLFKHTATNATLISNSEINILNLETQKLVLKDSKMKNIEKIFLNENGDINNCNITKMISVFGTATSNLKITNVQIDEIQREGLILLNSVTITNATITLLAEDGILFDDVSKSDLENVSVVTSGKKPFKFLNNKKEWKSVTFHDKQYTPINTQVPQKEVKKEESKKLMVPEYMCIMIVLMMGILSSVYFTCKICYILYCMFKPITNEYFDPPIRDRL